MYAEDPDNDFLPQTGKLTYLRQPEANRHVRVDTGVVENDEVSPFYDPMIAKLIVWDESRDRAIARMLRALDDYRIAGVTTNLSFLTSLTEHPAFKAAELDTNFINKHQQSLFAPANKQDNQALLLATLFILEKQKAPQQANTNSSPWQFSHGWRLNEMPTVNIALQHGEHSTQLTVQQLQQHYVIDVAGQQLCCTAELNGDELSAVLGDHRTKVRVSRYGDTISVFIKHQRYDFIYQTEVATEVDGSEHAGSLTAPMNGTIVAVMAKAGATVKAGDTLVIMEAMKMEYSIKAPKNGVVNEVFYAAGDLVKDGAELVDFSPEDA